MARPEHLFVYGTLRRGSPLELAGRLAAAMTWQGPAVWRGALWSLGEYPAAVQGNGQAGGVRGDLFQIAGPESLVEIDRYEGCGPNGRLGGTGFVREAHVVARDDGTRVAAWLYRFALPLPRSARPIPGGDWLAHERGREG